MCEFTVYLEGEIVFRDAIYVKTRENKVLLRNILGEVKVIDECRVYEVDVSSERLVLKPIKR